MPGSGYSCPRTPTRFTQERARFSERPRTQQCRTVLPNARENNPRAGTIPERRVSGVRDVSRSGQVLIFDTLFELSLAVQTLVPSNVNVAGASGMSRRVWNVASAVRACSSIRKLGPRHLAAPAAASGAGEEGAAGEDEYAGGVGDAVRVSASGECEAEFCAELYSLRRSERAEYRDAFLACELVRSVRERQAMEQDDYRDLRRHDVHVGPWVDQWWRECGDRRNPGQRDGRGRVRQRRGRRT